MSDLYGVALGGILGLVGSGVGQIISGRREDKKWLADNRKEEYRELLKSITEAATVIMAYVGTRGAKSGTAEAEYDRAFADALQRINDRIFIAEEIENIKLYDLWTTAIADLEKTGNLHTFSDRFEDIRLVILGSALKKRVKKVAR